MPGSAVASSRLVSTTLRGPAGSLEALSRIPAEPVGAAVVAHPHPLHGGTMHTKVVHRTAKLLSDTFGLTTLRFNFRGVGASEGRYDEGRGEVEDLLAAVELARESHRKGPFVLSGFSFGSVCALYAAKRVAPDVLLLIGVPVGKFDPAEVPLTRGQAVVWIHGDRDEHGEAERARQISARSGWSLRVVSDADHFFTGRLDAFESAAIEGLTLALRSKGLGP